jgi:Secretion system C-terminal sorting domain
MKILLLIVSLFISLAGENFAQVTLTMSNGQQLDAKTFQFDVYIRANTGSYTIKSYQAALTFNQSIINGTLSFNYVANSSALSNPPQTGIGVVTDGGDSHKELTFGSDVSNFTVGNTDELLGTFTLVSQNNFGSATPDIKWDFSDTYQTKLLDSNGDPITGGTFNDLSYSGALPVELTSFTASANNSGVNLTWKTATEVNNYGFEVERMTEGSSNSDWTKVGFVQGSGNSNSPKSYGFTDNNVSGGAKFLYRLKQKDIDGSFEYSDTVEVTLTAQYALYQNYPNPFNPTTTIKFDLPQAARVSLIVYNILGQKVMTLVNNETLSAGIHSVPFNGINLASGTYIYRLQTDKYVQIRKMILLK